MESAPTSKLLFFNRAGEPLGGPQEWSPALIALDAPTSQWDEARLTLQGRPLPIRLAKLWDRIWILTDWPLANPGHYLLEAAWPGGYERRIVTVQPQKISESSLSQLLTDLECEFPAAVAMALQQMGALAGIKLRPPGESTLDQEVTRLRHAVLGTSTRAGLERVLADLADRPHQILHRTELWVRTGHARRPDPNRLQEAAYRGSNRTDSGHLKAVLDSRVEHSVDVYENRLVRAFTHQVQQRLRGLCRVLIAAAGHADLADVLQDLQRRLDWARRRAKFLDDVTLPRHLMTQATMVLLKRPAYKAALKGYLAFRRAAAVRLEDARLDAPLDNLPALYQLWGTLTAIQVFLEVGASLGYRVKRQALVRPYLDELCVRVLPDGKPAVVLVHPGTETVATLIPERTYSGKGVLRSISFQQRPDIAIEITSPGRETAVVILDPKYKLDSEGNSLAGDDPGVGISAPKKSDIDKMHAYRDAIRDNYLRRVVTYAAILYPGPTRLFEDGIEALNSNPFAAPELRARLWSVLQTALAR